MKNSQKGFVIPLLIVIAVLVIGEGAYFFSKNTRVSQINNSEITSTHSQLMTYVSNNGEYEFRYQKELYVIESSENFVNLSNVNSDELNKKSLPSKANLLHAGVFAYGSESFIKNGQTMKPKEYLHLVASDYGRKADPVIGEEQITISGIDGWKISVKSKEGYSGELIAVYSGDLLYVISFSGPSDLVTRTSKNILDTFKFAEWKTWVDSVSGFTFDYPETWDVCNIGQDKVLEDFKVVLSKKDACNKDENLNAVAIRGGNFNGIIVRIKNNSEPTPFGYGIDGYGKLDPILINGLNIIRHKTSTYSPVIASVAFERKKVWYAVDAQNIGDNMFERIYRSFRFSSM